MLQTMKTGCNHDPLLMSETLYAVYRSPVYARDYQNRPWSHPLSVTIISWQEQSRSTFVTIMSHLFYRIIPEFDCQEVICRGLAGMPLTYIICGVVVFQWIFLIRIITDNNDCSQRDPTYQSA